MHCDRYAMKRKHAKWQYFGKSGLAFVLAIDFDAVVKGSQRMQRAVGQLDVVKRDEIDKACPAICNDNLDGCQASQRCSAARASFVNFKRWAHRPAFDCKMGKPW